MRNSTPTYFELQLSLLKRLVALVEQTEPFTTSPMAESDEEFFHSLIRLTQDMENHEGDYLYQGQQVLSRIVSAYPHITPVIPRDLFWHFSGDCLHFMPDDEIERFQQLDDLRFEAEAKDQPFDWEQAKASVFKLH